MKAVNIYAPNGLMKTSLEKTFSDISKEKRIFNFYNFSQKKIIEKSIILQI